MDYLFGLEHPYLKPYQKTSLHTGILDDLKLFSTKAADAGLELMIVSGHRDFVRQKLIWNRKLQHADDLEEKIHEVLRFSAVPGLSRHHWGTDFDLADQVALTPDYNILLEDHEYQPGGVFENLGRWLGSELSKPQCPFFRPYEHDLGGVACEPWHLSHKKQASIAMNEFNDKEFRRFFNSPYYDDLIGHAYLKDHLSDVMERYFYMITPPQ